MSKLSDKAKIYITIAGFIISTGTLIGSYVYAQGQTSTKIETLTKDVKEVKEKQEKNDDEDEEVKMIVIETKTKVDNLENTANRIERKLDDLKDDK